MKNKKLLSLLCLVALVGCGTPSTSSYNNQPSSPASSSAVAPSSPVSSSTEEVNSSTASSSSSSSSSSSTTPIVESKINALKERVANGTSGTLKKADFVQTSLGAASSKRMSTSFYSNVMFQETTIGYNTESAYKAIKDNRYYEVKTDAYDNTTLESKKIVEEVVNDNEITLEEANNNIKNYATHATLSNAFGITTSFEGIVNGIFNEYNEEQCYDIRFETSYSAFDANEGKVTSLSYVKAIYNPTFGDTKVFKYSAEFNFNSNDELGSLRMMQAQYNPAAFDVDNGCLEAGYLATSTTIYDYSFEYGELEENTDFNIDDYVYTDYEIKFYKTREEEYNYTTSEYDYIYSDEITDFSIELETGTTLYMQVTGTPETATDDKPVLVELSEYGAINKYVGSSFEEFTFQKEGEVTLTFESAKGIQKSYTFKTFAPTPESITLFSEIESTIAVNQEIYLPNCEIAPSNASQEYKWEILSGSEFAKLNFDGYKYTLKGIAAGEVVLKASSIANPEVYTTCEIEILDNLSEEELKEKLTTTSWGVKFRSLVYQLSLSNYGTGVINFGKESDDGLEVTFTFNWELDYSTSIINVTKGEWHNVDRYSNFYSWKFTSMPLILQVD